jgi:hypothetical protein
MRWRRVARRQSAATEAALREAGPRFCEASPTPITGKASFTLQFLFADLGHDALRIPTRIVGAMRLKDGRRIDASWHRGPIDLRHNARANGRGG